MTLHLNRTGDATNIPLTADAFDGGLVKAKDGDRKPMEGDKGAAKPDEAKSNVKAGSSPDVTITGNITGYWGFDHFDGPTVALQQVAGKDWKIVSKTPLMAGQDNHLTLNGDGTACVEHVALASEKDKDVDVSFKPTAKDGKPVKDSLDLDVPLKEVKPGGYALGIKQFGDPNMDKVPLTAYTADIHLDTVKIHAGDNQAEIAGDGVKDVVSVQIGDQTFTPAAKGNDDHTVHLEAKAGVSPENGSEAEVKLKDGRTMKVKIATEAARPGLNLVSFKSMPTERDGDLPIALNGKEEIPLDGTLTFVVQTKDTFPRTQTIEVATADNSVHTTLSLASNNLVLQDEHTAVAKLSPLKELGKSAFGKLQMRPVAADGTAGNWTPLGTLVRTPRITAIHCATGATPACTAEGSDLFLVEAFAGGKDFAKPTEVPTGFAENKLTVPAPADGSTLYLKLRDDPNNIATLQLPASKPGSAATTAKTAPAPAAAPSQAAGAPPPAPDQPAPTSPAATPAASSAQPH
jgi:hypothetical protein